MKAEANSVNIKNADGAYHHGDLRESAISEGLRLLQASEAEALSLRQIARNVGVSATALYRHFPDKASLLSALAVAGFVRLGRQQASAGQVGGPAGFAAIGQAYVHFAIANPALFRLMFARTPLEMNADSVSPADSAAGLLERGIASLLPVGASQADRFAAMLRAWSLVHGLAMLILDRQVDERVARDMIDRIVSADSLRFG